MALKHAGQVIADALQRQDVDLIFGVPGESFLPVLDGLYTHEKQMRFITSRHESGASFMAEAYGKLTGKPGVLMVTRGPGASNAAIGIHTALQDSTPMVVLIGQVGTDMAEREAFQEVDYRRMFGESAKWVGSIDKPERIDEYISHAFHLAQSGRPGPVVLALPEDVLFALVESKPVEKAHVIRPGLNQAEFQKALELLKSAKNPMVLVGGGGWTKKACVALEEWLKKENLPGASAFRFQDLIDAQHPCYAGDLGIAPNPKLAQRFKDADVVLAIGPRLGEMTSGIYTLFEVPVTKQKLIHVHMGASELGSVYRPELAINAAYEDFCIALNQQALNLKLDQQDQGPAAHQEYLAFNQALDGAGQLNMSQIVSRLNDLLPDDAIVTNGAGNFAGWVHRFYRYGGLGQHGRTQLAPTNGAMGYGLPAAIAAKLQSPEKVVIGFCGDGDFMMSCQELATCMRYDAYPIIVVVNNGMLGTIRMHQEREYSKRVIATELANPDFVLFAQSFGMPGYKVTKTEDFFTALESAMQSKKGAIIEVVTDPEQITPTKRLSEL
jgi:acetolactate synthase-1/2/3 large subunit